MMVGREADGQDLMFCVGAAEAHLSLDQAGERSQGGGISKLSGQRARHRSRMTK